MIQPVLTPEMWKQIDPHAPDEWARKWGFRGAAARMLAHYSYFKWNDVDDLREIAPGFHHRGDGQMERALLDLADRIAALLPPRDDEA